ncbi:hypothetical protein FFWV33_02775 [Flavobacterium faecale]|uniref:Uncharacterized protein n=1 Tax=Flavobacterium faecale TaxID=1355330 RepID=A0A2S1L9U7_9FLAO|nr:hypothetical protein [Flavobacterium faecale]AWG20529.1 hypothetical protein FFWV33_02775 [Flavobacterium faecale]
MSYLCLNCAHINEKSTDEKCENCESVLDTVYYNRLKEYSNQTVIYGFNYRRAYEEQVKKNGEVNEKFSLIAPTDYFDFLAIAALSGMVGNFAYDLVKNVAKQIYTKLKNKSEEEKLDNSEKELIELISDPSKLNLFIIYIKARYKNAKLHKKVQDAIAEEEIVHAMLNDKTGKDGFWEAFGKIEEGMSPTESCSQLFKYGAFKAGKLRRDKPNIKELESLLKTIKKDLKKEKKLRKKKK